MILFYLFLFLLFIIFAYLWVNGIDFMQENHPDYKGEDFLNWDSEIQNEKDNIHK